MSSSTGGGLRDGGTGSGGSARDLGSSVGPEPVERDSRGILDPWLLRQRVRLARYPATPALAGLVDWFWAVRWDLPPGTAHRQQVLTHPGANVSVGHPNARPGDHGPGPVEARIYGAARGLSERVLTGQGWTVAALTRPGGLGALAAGPASDYTDRVVPLGAALGTDEAALLRQVLAEPEEESRVRLLAAALERAADPARVPAATEVARVARLAEMTPAARSLSTLCELAGARPRSLQRLFLRYAGVPPTWVIRRYRLLDAAEAVRGGEPVSWAGLAASLGYADQAHLIRDFRAAIGQTPAAYAGSVAAR